MLTNRKWKIEKFFDLDFVTIKSTYFLDVLDTVMKFYLKSLKMKFIKGTEIDFDNKNF